MIIFFLIVISLKDLKFIEENYLLFKNGTSNREIRHNFFSKIETELLAYLLGFIMSDGSINDKRNTVTIHINEKDKEIFELFLVISPNAHIGLCKSTESTSLVRGHTVKNNGSIRLSISSKILLNDLHKLGIVENKTYKELHIPKMPKELIRHFIRGYFDGDGCFTWSARKPDPKRRKINWTLAAAFSICAKTNSLLLEFLKLFALYEVSLNLNYSKRDDMYILITSAKKNVENLYHFLYDNSTYYLSRKYNKYSHYVNTEVTLLIAEYRNALEVSVKESNNLPTSTEHPTTEDENIC